MWIPLLITLPFSTYYLLSDSSHILITSHRKLRILKNKKKEKGYGLGFSYIYMLGQERFIFFLIHDIFCFSHLQAPAIINSWK